MLGGAGSGQINMDLTNNPSGTNDLINAGNLSLYSSTLQVNPVNTFLGTGSYHLIHYTGTLTGSVASMTLLGVPANTRSTYNLSNATPSYITLEVGGALPANLVWKGNSSTNVWDMANTSNLMWSNGGTPDTFYNLDQVAFDDTGSNNPVVNLAAIVMPSSVIVNSTHDYTISGTGRISGSATVTKSGAGHLNRQHVKRLHGRDHHYRRHDENRRRRRIGQRDRRNHHQRRHARSQRHGPPDRTDYRARGRRRQQWSHREQLEYISDKLNRGRPNHADRRHHYQVALAMVSAPTTAVGTSEIPPAVPGRA